MYNSKYYKNYASGDVKMELDGDMYDNLTIPYATAFVRPQKYTQIYPLPEGFSKGTIFPELYSPYKR